MRGLRQQPIRSDTSRVPATLHPITPSNLLTNRTRGHDARYCPHPQCHTIASKSGFPCTTYLPSGPVGVLHERAKSMSSTSSWASRTLAQHRVRVSYRKSSDTETSRGGDYELLNTSPPEGIQDATWDRVRVSPPPPSRHELSDTDICTGNSTGTTSLQHRYFTCKSICGGARNLTVSYTKGFHHPRNQTHTRAASTNGQRTNTTPPQHRLILHTRPCPEGEIPRQLS